MCQLLPNKAREKKKKCRMSGSTPELLNQNLSFRKVPRQSADTLNLRSTILEYLGLGLLGAIN